MINHEYKFLFVRVAKVASTSCISCLPKLTSTNNKWKYDKNHIPLWYYRDSILTEGQYKNYFKFAFVRNPYDRSVSIWKYWNSYSKQYKGPTFDFKTVLTTDSEVFNKEKFNSKYSNQYEFTQGCDFIGKFENLQEDFDDVCDKIGITRRQLPHKNKRKHKHYTEYYDDEARQIVAEKYAKDIEYFGYEFGED